MKRYLQSERGYTLLIVVGVLVVFTIIGTSLMTLNLNSLKKNESRESNIQAKDLSIKGIDYILSEIDYKMMETTVQARNLQTNAMQNYGPMKDGLNAKDYISKFNGVLENYKCSVNTSQLTNTSTGEATYCIEELQNKSDDNPYQKIVTFKSIGISNSKEHVTKAKYEIGVASNLEAFNYALTSYGYNESNKNKGNIDLHGGLQVNGNIHADNNFYISNKSKYKNHTVDSIYPIIKGIDYPKARIEVRHDRLFKSDAFTTTPTSNKVESNSVSSIQADYTEAADLNIDFEISSKVNSKRYDESSSPMRLPTQWTLPTSNNYALVTKWETIKLVTYAKGVNSTNLQSNRPQEILKPWGSSYDDIYNYDWNVYGNNHLNSIAFPKDLTMSLSKTNFKVDDYAYIDEDFVIGLNYDDDVNFDLFDNILDVDVLKLLTSLESIVNIETPVNLEGTYYVNGDLVIAGARLTGKATFFVNGKTRIAFSEVGESENEDSNITIISKGPVHLSYMSNNHNDLYKGSQSFFTEIYKDDVNRSYWNGHIHSDESVTLDAATSYLTINGSISAPNIYATSIKGRAEASCENIGTYLRTILREILGPLFGGLLGSLGESILNGLVGENDNTMVRVGDINGSNCFQKEQYQKLDSTTISNYLIKLLNLGLLKLPSTTINVEPRLIINYSDKPKVDYMRFETFYELDTPRQISRE